MMTLEEAIAEVKRVYADVRGVDESDEVRQTILAAVSSGDLIPKAERDAETKKRNDAEKVAIRLTLALEAAGAEVVRLREVIPPLIVIALDNLDGMNAETREECERDIAKARAALTTKETP